MTLQARPERSNRAWPPGDSDAQPILCHGCGETIAETFHEYWKHGEKIQRSDGEQWHHYCSEDCYREWCERTAWKHEKLVFALNIRLRAVENTAAKAKATSYGREDDQLLVNETDPKWRERFRYPARLGSIMARVTEIIDRLGELSDGRENEVYRPSPPRGRT